MKEKYKELFFNRGFVALILFAILFRVIWFSTPLELDEGNYLYLSNRWIEGENPYQYETNKSPVLLLNYLLVNITVGNSFIFFRIFVAGFFFMTLMFLLLLLFEMENNRDKALYGGAIFVILMHIPLIQGFLLKPGTIFIFYFILSLYFLHRYFNERIRLYFWMSSVFFGMSFFSNSFNVSFVALYIVFIYFINTKEFKNTIYFLIPAVFIFLGSVFLFLFYYKTNLIVPAIDWLIAIFSANYGSLTENTHNYSFPFLFFQSVLPFVLIFVSNVVGYKKKNNIFRATVFFTLSMFLAVLVVPAFGHYFVSFIPLFVIISIRGKSLNQIRILVVILLLLYPLISYRYYPNLNIEGSVMFQDFASYNEQNEVVKFLRRNLSQKENTYYWGWNPGLYWLLDKPSAFYNNPLFGCLLNKNITRREEKFDFKYLVASKSYEKNCIRFNELIGFESQKKIYDKGNFEIYLLEE